MKILLRTKRSAKQQSGFTIVELMIATTVFSLVLIVILYGVLSFSHAYYAGVNSATTQDTARTIVDNVSQAIEFSGNTITTPTKVSGNTYYFCAGGATYYYILGDMYDGATPQQNDPGLYVVPGKCGALVASDFSTAGGKELLGPNLRITYLSVAQSASSTRLYSIGLSLSYGDSDLLCQESLASGQPGGCAPNDPYNPQGKSVIGASVDDISCRHSTGYEFCAHAGLSTTVSLRVANGVLGP